MTSWSYTVPLVASWARARLRGAKKGARTPGKRGKTHFTDPKHAAAMEAHRLHALAARPRGWATDGVYVVDVFYCPPDGRRRDSDRVRSLVLDALKGVAFDDDSDRYVVDGRGRCLRDEPYTDSRPHVEPGCTYVVITRIGDAPVKARKRGAR